jgi:hypothetical protein
MQMNCGCLDSPHRINAPMGGANYLKDNHAPYQF